jgi:sigma-E factor negative regulatory protein RseC
MIEEQAVVISCEGDSAEVETQRKSACGDCSASGVCGTAAVTQMFGNRRSVLRVANPIAARPGDRVVIGVEDSVITYASFISYMVPVFALILTAILSQFIAARLGVVATEPYAILGGLFGLTFGLLLVRRFSNRINQDRRYQPAILRLARNTVTVDFKPDANNLQ